MFNLIPNIEIHYSLSNLEKKNKIKLNYLLSGRKGKYGLLKKYNGKLLKPGLIEILPESEKIFISNIEKITSKFVIKKVFTLI